MNLSDPSRRDVLKFAGLAAAAATFGPAAAHAFAAASFRPQRGRALRIAHLTDIHIEPEKRADQGTAAAIRHANALADKPDLIITGGDHVFDSFEAAEARTRVQWELFAAAVAAENRIPVLSCLGNHDCWGWNKKRSGTTGEEPLWGKARATDQLKMPARFHSAERAGWHLVFLDSIFPHGDGYIGKIDEEQFEWLKGDLAAVKPGTPTLVTSHIPIFSIAAMQFGGKDERPANEVDPSLMHLDAGRLHKLFLQDQSRHGERGGVKLCISGHLHLLDRCEFDGVTYLCNGAVCGNWWKGRHQQCDEGYAVLDLFDDGTFERRYQTYGWKAVP